ncbi:unnamed protein product [Gongylonema pulchrum]|uniref:Uncharacterized protein n=1 Tax=Gongylonema pulchrum TaxID=637853 RepID=A0A183ER72_9BILA|nr:unnamed protein product [Gongylonema pulchrum]
MSSDAPSSPPTNNSSSNGAGAASFLESTYRRSNSTTTTVAGAVSPPPPSSTGRHRRLPPTPEQRPSARRCSSPRFLPTPPSPAAAPLDFFGLGSAAVLERRPSSGRRLPKPPNVAMNAASAAAVTRYSSVESDANTARAVAANGWPSPIRAERKFSEVRRRNSLDVSGAAAEDVGDSSVPPCALFATANVVSSSQRRPQQQQPVTARAAGFSQSRGSLDHSSGTPSSTNARSRSSSLSPSNEQNE